MDQQQAREIMKKSQEDPNWFFRNVLGTNPWPKQEKIALSVRDNVETSVKSCHGAGKTFVAASIALWFSCCFRPSIVITTAPTDRQVRTLLWKEIRVRYANAKLPLGGKLLTQSLTWEDNWWMIGFTAPEYDPERFAGFHESHILVIVDEASGVSHQIMEAIDGVLSSEHAHKLEIGNPTDPNSPFADSFKFDDVKKFTLSAYDTPNFTAFGIKEKHIADGSWKKRVGNHSMPYSALVTPAWVAARYKRWGPTSPMYRVRVLGEFPVEGENTLIPMSWLEAAKQRKLKPDYPHHLGVDVARFGSDETVIYERKGNVLRKYAGFSKTDTVQTYDEVIKALKATGADTVKVDGVGIGGAVVDMLKAGGYPVQDINNSEKAVADEDYYNVRAESYWQFRERFEKGEIDIGPDDEQLVSELSSIQYQFDNKNRIQIEKKEHMKSRGLPSPNNADAAVLAMFDPKERKRAIARAWGRS